MTLIGLLLLSTSVDAPFVGPTPHEFASALAGFTGKHVKVTDLRHLSCKGFGADEPTEADCSWQQRNGKNWNRYSTYVAVDRSGWHLIDEPNRKP